MSDIKVSVIIPIFNPGDAIINCLNSIVTQSLREMEILCINDGSTDNSLEILNEFAKRESRLKIITQKNSGAGVARNKGLENSKGEYILFLDCDDWIEDNACELLYNHAKKTDSDLVLFDSLIHNDENLEKLPFFKGNYPPQTFNYMDIKDKVFHNYLGVIWNKLYKSDFLNENNIQFPSHKIFNDVEFHIKTMTLAKKITYHNTIFYHYNNTTHFSLQNEHVGSKSSLVFSEVINDVKNFLNSADLMKELKGNFLNFSCSEFKVKLYHIDKKYKMEYYNRIKTFFKSIDVNESDLESDNLLFYKNIMESDSYEEFLR